MLFSSQRFSEGRKTGWLGAMGNTGFRRHCSVHLQVKRNLLLIGVLIREVLSTFLLKDISRPLRVLVNFTKGFAHYLWYLLSCALLNSIAINYQFSSETLASPLFDSLLRVRLKVWNPGFLILHLHLLERLYMLRPMYTGQNNLPLSTTFIKTHTDFTSPCQQPLL